MYPNDDKVTKIDEIDPGCFEMIDTSNFAEFDGTCAHGVSPFRGERWSVIYFTASTINVAAPEALETLTEWGAFTFFPEA